MPEADNYLQPLELIEGWLCLDFVNHIRWKAAKATPAAPLVYKDVLEWAGAAGVLSGAQVRALRASARRHPAKAKRALEETLGFQQTIHRMLSNLNREEPIHQDDLDVLNHTLSLAMTHIELVAWENTFVWSWRNEALDPTCSLWPVARSIARLLTSDELNRVGVCANPACGWLFFDTSKNRSRRWCSMRMCGNVTKARRHYARHKKQRA